MDNTEDRLIYANDFLDLFYVASAGQDKSFIKTVEMVLEDTPTVEVKHGYWIDSYSVDHIGRITGHSIDCSVCDSVFKDDSREVVKHWKARFEVCPFCGAKMDLED